MTYTLSSYEDFEDIEDRMKDAQESNDGWSEEVGHITFAQSRPTRNSRNR